MPKTSNPPSAPELMDNGHYKSPAGMSVLSSRKLNPTRMRKLLGGIGITATQHGEWVGWPLKKYAEMNPDWTEREWFDLVCENRDMILAPPALTVRRSEVA